MQEFWLVQNVCLIKVIPIHIFVVFLFFLRDFAIEFVDSPKRQRDTETESKKLPPGRMAANPFSSRDCGHAYVPSMSSSPPEL